MLVAWLAMPALANAADPIVTFGRPPLIDVAYSPDGRHLATLTTRFVEILDAESLSSVVRTPLADGASIRYSRDGRLIAVVSRFEGLDIRETDRLERWAFIPVRTSEGRIHFSPDGALLVYAERHRESGPTDTVYLRDVRQRKVVGKLTGDPVPTLEHYMRHDGGIQRLKHTGAPHQRIEAVAFHPDGRTLAIASVRSSVALWDGESGAIRRYLHGPGLVWPDGKIAFSPDGSSLAAPTTANGFLLWDVASGQLHDVETPGTDQPIVLDFAFTRDGQHLVLGGNEGILRVVDHDDMSPSERSSSTLVDPLPFLNPPKLNRMDQVTVHPDGTRVATLVDDTHIAVWDTDNFLVQRRLHGWGRFATDAVCLTGLGRIVTGVGNRILCAWDAETGLVVDTLESQQPIDGIVAHPDGVSVAVNTDREAQVWDLARHTRTRKLDPSPFFLHLGGFSSMALSSSGRYVARIGRFSLLV